MAAAELRIVLDANVICADPWLQGKESRVFFEGVQIIGARVYVPRVALDEALNINTERLRECRSRLEGAAREWQDTARAQRQKLVTNESFEDARRSYEEHLLKALAERKVELLPYPQVGHEEVVRRALDRRRPFGPSGGYRDTLIWLSMLELLKANPAAVWFVTQNSKDFGSGPGPAPDFVWDFKQHGLSGDEMRIYSSLAVLNTDKIVPHLQRQASKVVSGFALEPWVKTALMELLKEDRWMQGMIGVAPGHVAVMRDEVRLLKLVEARVDDVLLLPSGDTLVEAHAVLDLCYAIALNQEYLQHEDVQAAFPHLTRIENPSAYYAPVLARVHFGLVLEGVGSRLLSADIETVQGTVSPG